MNGDVRCPFCGYEYQDEEWWEVIDGDGAEVEMECPRCEKEFKATLQISTDAWFEVDEEDYIIGDDE